MADTAITVDNPLFGQGILVLEHYTSAALTAATEKKEWVVPFNAVIREVIVDSETAGSGGTSDILDLNKNGTTVYTTQANRPTLLVGNTGKWTQAGKPEVTKVKAGDILSYDIDQICTTGSARVKVVIVLAPSR